MLVHIRYGGESLDVEANLLDVGDLSTNDQILTAVANHLTVDGSKLYGYQVDRSSDGDITVRPQATFG